MRRTPIVLTLLLTLWMTSGGWCQTDPQGRTLAWQLFQAYEAGSNGSGYAQFESLFTSDPQLTRRAFVSTMEYATEIYQEDMQGAQQAVSFANALAGMIGSQLGDPVPSALMQKLISQDPSAMSEFARYATALYPAYASGGQSGPGASYSQNPGTLRDPGRPYSSGEQAHPDAYGPSSGPGAYADVDSDDDGAYGPDSSSYGPGAESPYGPGSSPYGPGSNGLFGPGATPYGPGPNTLPSGPNGNAPFRPANATGGPAKE